MRSARTLTVITSYSIHYTKLYEGVKESRKVLDLIKDVQARGMPIILISHNMPHVFEVSDRIHIHRLGKRHAVIRPEDYSMSDAVAMMTGAMEPPAEIAPPKVH